MEAMGNARVPGGYLVRIVSNYLDDKEIIVETSTGTVSGMISGGVPQGLLEPRVQHPEDGAPFLGELIGT